MWVRIIGGSVRCMMKLTDLNPRWVGAGGKGVSRKNPETGEMEPAPERHAVGIWFDCPCLSGTCTRVYIDFKNPLDGGESYQPSEKHQWERTGEDFETLKLHPSIQRVGGCEWHGHVGLKIPGEITVA